MGIGALFWAHWINPRGFLGVKELGSKGVKTIVFLAGVRELRGVRWSYKELEGVRGQ
ncbi:hypothetical protein [Marseilla massiliensis]|uniref:Uncharacterized protein n=1 Tax=Marseilla massiliensis TaxID=1841864 RepID=A0A938WLH7_9BACT|nr:hypothetical protein [Marseilla massiliensis]MBM6660898.1 hypothetical protein [Marseilla massiliensis]